VSADSRAPDADIHAGRTVVRLRGEQDASTAARLSTSMSWAIAFDNSDLVLDLSEVEFMDGWTARVLMRTRVLLAQRARCLVLRAPPECALPIIELAGLGDLVEPQRTQDEVVAAPTHGPRPENVLHIDPARSEHPAGRGGP
jgi:anti-anti-sigma factor